MKLFKCFLELSFIVDKISCILCFCRIVRVVEWVSDDILGIVPLRPITSILVEFPVQVACLIDEVFLFWRDAYDIFVLAFRKFIRVEV